MEDSEIEASLEMYHSALSYAWKNNRKDYVIVIQERMGKYLEIVKK